MSQTPNEMWLAASLRLRACCRHGALDVVRRLRAYSEGCPVKRGTTKRLSVARDVDLMVVAFVRIGGESRPWGIAFGHPNEDPDVISVPDGRDRTAVAEMCADFAPPLLEHFRSPRFTGEELKDWENLRPGRQIWLPNASHIDMLHHIAYAYTFTRSGGEDRPTLKALGRLTAWLFREAQREGQTTIVSATSALRDAFTFPAEDMRQGHLGFLHAWLDGGSREARMDKAFAAERESTSTNLDPDLEREKLADLVEVWNDHKGAPSRRATEAKRKIRQHIEPELTRRWSLVEKTIETIRGDERPINAGVEALETESLKEMWFQYHRIEQKWDDERDGPAFVPSVETDRHSAAAASRYYVYEASADLVTGLLVHYDDELLAEAVAVGEAVSGQIVEVRDDSETTGVRPVWVIEDRADRQLRLRTGSFVAVVGFPDRRGYIRSLADSEEGHLLIEVEITKLKTDRRPGPGIHAMHPADDELKGREIAVIAAPSDEISRRKSQKAWDKNGPGAWLTHSSPRNLYAQHAPEDADDVAAVEAAVARS